ncbi:hypothetical protein MHYP_G00126760 [Metynnis hypsauchen]
MRHPCFNLVFDVKRHAGEKAQLNYNPGAVLSYTDDVAGEWQRLASHNTIISPSDRLGLNDNLGLRFATRLQRAWCDQLQRYVTKQLQDRPMLSEKPWPPL